MATKKQKRERGLANREAMLAKEKTLGLAAQERAREYHREQQERMDALAQEYNEKLARLAGVDAILRALEAHQS